MGLIDHFVEAHGKRRYHFLWATKPGNHFGFFRNELKIKTGSTDLRFIFLMVVGFDQLEDKASLILSVVRREIVTIRCYFFSIQSTKNIGFSGEFLQNLPTYSAQWNSIVFDYTNKSERIQTSLYNLVHQPYDFDAIIDEIPSKCLGALLTQLNLFMYFEFSIIKSYVLQYLTQTVS